MTGYSDCRVCGIRFKWRKVNSGKPAIYCSRICQSTQVHTWNDKNRFKWKNATEEQKIERIRNIFERNVIKSDGCWDWKGSVHKSGYAPMNYDDKQKNAHIISWMLNYGKFPDGLNVLHKCDNRKCTNPEHLFLGTPKDNTQDMIKKNRHNRLSGTRHSNSKLNEEKVREIKKLIKLGVTMTRISKDFDISSGALQAIKDGITWKHIN